MSSHILTPRVASLALGTVVAGLASLAASPAAFDHDYVAYQQVLAASVAGERVDYRALSADRAALDAVATSFDAPATHDIASWSRDEQLAFWINAYNVFTLKAVVDHYPIERRRFSLHPSPSIRQIAGVWDRLRWRAAGQLVTLDHIEHGILRGTLREPLIHFAVNCASVSCPPLAEEPYRAATVTAQLEAAARRFLSGPQGLRIEGRLWRVTRLFKWYGDDFIERYAEPGPGRVAPREAAIRGVLQRYGPPAITEVVVGRVRIGYLPYDWRLNDVDITN